MAVRPPINLAAQERMAERLDKLTGRAYFLWLIGIAVGVVKLKPEKMSFGGLEYSIQNPDVIQGLIFVGCLLTYVTIFGIVQLNSLEWKFPNRTFVRRSIHLASRPRYTLQGLTRKEIVVLKKTARQVHRTIFIMGLLMLCFPVAHILLFERGPLWAAIKTIFT